MAFGLDMSEYLDKLTELQENQTMYSENISNLHNIKLCKEIRILSAVSLVSTVQRLNCDLPLDDALLEAYYILVSLWDEV